ncbi:uncharacterized protein [Diabrotica undecimpunctata]|uniref:uncharacterized protein n=1 Tax=Diabrotica undecimpunctata TaxID=50387 RepID=UPI003B63A5F6
MNYLIICAILAVAFASPARVDEDDGQYHPDNSGQYAGDGSGAYTGVPAAYSGVQYRPQPKAVNYYPGVPSQYSHNGQYRSESQDDGQYHPDNSGAYNGDGSGAYSGDGSGAYSGDHSGAYSGNQGVGAQNYRYQGASQGQVAGTVVQPTVRAQPVQLVQSVKPVHLVQPVQSRYQAVHSAQARPVVDNRSSVQIAYSNNGPFSNGQYNVQYKNQDGHNNGQYKIIRKSEEVLEDGYHYVYETENGISAEEEGHLVERGTEHEHMFVKGFYTYPGPDGVKYTVEYTSDGVNGFVPVGAHIPTASDAQQRSVVQQK